MLLFVGLGNPTPDSENNRHNVGFKIIDAINKKSIELTWLDLEGYLLNLKTSMDSENYSRGQQTVDFVERVRDYYYLLLAQNCRES